MDDTPLPAIRAPAAPVEGEYPGSLADDVAVGACAGLGAMALVAPVVVAALRSGLVPFSPLLRWYFQGGTLVLLGTGLVAAMAAETHFPRRLFALFSVLCLSYFGLRELGVGSFPLQIAIGLTMLGGAVVWMRRPMEYPGHAQDADGVLTSGRDD